MKRFEVTVRKPAYLPTRPMRIALKTRNASGARATTKANAYVINCRNVLRPRKPHVKTLQLFNHVGMDLG